MPGRRPPPDFGRTVEDYARFRADYPPELFERLAGGYSIGVPGQRVLDVGTGTGLVARALARRGCVVTGLDPSPALLEAAAAQAAAAGLEATFLRGTAEATGLPEASFDVVTAAVCWHWFDPDRAAAELRRVLVAGGRIAIIHFEWLAEPGNVVEATETLLQRNRSGIPGRATMAGFARALLGRVAPALARGLGAGLHPDRLTTLRAAGFTAIESFSFDADIAYDHAAWRGRIRSHAWAGASAGSRRVARLDAEVAALLRDRFAPEPLAVPHRIFVVVGRAP